MTGVPNDVDALHADVLKRKPFSALATPFDNPTIDQHQLSDTERRQLHGNLSPNAIKTDYRGTLAP